MNIKEAKEEIKRTLKAYSEKKDDGSFVIPIEKQRPLLLIGPPGIGKTAIMKQIAEELRCGLVSYSMTHHTRQSAIGLPFISEKEYGGKKWSVTEYTMSEIVASIYEYMSKTGKPSGILFLDEINCVSETLTPVMLQLLQNKTFGNIPLPRGWTIITAGNPPEYNKSVRDFDMVTLDRVKYMEIEANLDVWLEYAKENNIHPAIRAYLSAYPGHFYSIEEKDTRQYFVTARGWEDLSLMLNSYEKEDVNLSPEWFLQYLQQDSIARSFAFYYSLYKKVKKGNKDKTLEEMLIKDHDELKALSSSECLALSSMMFEGIQFKSLSIQRESNIISKKRALLKQLAQKGDPITETKARNFFERNTKALLEKTDKGIVRISESVSETKALKDLEEDLFRWFEDSKKIDLSEYENSLLLRQEEALRDEEKALSKTIEKAYDLLSLCPEGEKALMYFASDLESVPSCALVLKDFPLKIHEKLLDEIKSM